MINNYICKVIKIELFLPEKGLNLEEN